MLFLRSRFLLAISLVLWLLPLPLLKANNLAYNAAKKKTLQLLKTEKFQEIEALATEYKAQPYTIIDRWPALHGLHDAFDLKGDDDDHQWQQRKQTLDRWIAAYPDSCTAKTVLADWWIGYAWKARGIGRAGTVTETGWKLMRERLEQAVNTLDQVPPGAIDDPEYFRIYLTAIRGQSRPGEEANACFEKGIAFAKEYYPLYGTHAYFLLPRWYGEKGDRERFAVKMADTFAPEKGDIFYAYLIYSRASFDKDTEFKTWTVDYERVKRGYLRLLEEHPAAYHSHARSELCFIASLQEDYPTAKKLFLSVENLRNSAFGDRANFLKMRKASGAQAAIDEARKAEQEGRLDDAEAIYRSFTDDPSTNEWLKYFYLCHGMKEKFHATKAKERFDVDIAKAHPNTWADLARYGPLVHEWEITKDAAQRFDALRPFNLTGRAALLLCAAHEGDREQAEAIRKSIVEYQSKRPAYQIAQTVLSGEKTWEEVAPTLMKSDGLSQQAALTLAAYYLTQENYDKARTILTEMLPSTEYNAVYTAVFQSLLQGSLAPMFKDSGKKPLVEEAGADPMNANSATVPEAATPPATGAETDL